jgi:hypothetical protein
MNITNVSYEYIALAEVGRKFVLFWHTSKFLLIPDALATLFHFVV